VCLAEESRAYVSGRTSTSRGLQDVLTSILADGSAVPIDPLWIITDQNGEPYRALDWGHAAVALLRGAPRFVDPVLWYPASSFGDTGTASGGVALCLAIRAFVRGYAPSSAAIVLSAADDARRAAVLVGGPN
jgi:3-oxoacyl-[acyl-carrier-protein] synthase-1